MSAFVDVELPDAIRGFNWVSSPRFNTQITAVKNGDEHRNINWVHPLHRFSAPEGINCMEHVEDLRDHFMVMRGAAYTFPLRDPFDFASRRLTKVNLQPTPISTDQVIGIGDGIETTFQLKKTYTRGSQTYVRNIHLPVTGSVEIAINALDPSTPHPALPGGPYTFDVTRYGGQVIFDHAPRNGQIITAGFLFDVEVRFESDDQLDAIVKAFQVSGFSDLSFWEVRFCDDGVTT